MSSINLRMMEELSPYIVREGIFGATFKKNKESLIFLRMELLVNENIASWTQFKQMSSWVANLNNGVLSGLVRRAGEANYPNYEKIKEVTGFTNEEYIEFTKKAIQLKSKNNKIADIIAHNSVGINHMITYSQKEQVKYIVYASKNREFSIQDANTHMTIKPATLKNYFEEYNDILITMGSDFSKNDYFENRGISRNPYWVFEEQYSGLSMILHGFTGAVAERYFPEKKRMHVKPIGSMQCILKKNLLSEEGYIEIQGKKTDITSLEVSSIDSEGEMNYIKTSALTRIYNQAIIRSL